MAKSVSHIRASVLALGVSLGLAVQGVAAPLPQVQPETPRPAVVEVQADCYAIGQRVAAERGGTLARASAATRGGRTVCVIVIVVPGKDGKRGQRQEIEVPAG